MRVLLEFIRIVLIFILLGGMMGYILQSVYMVTGSNTEEYSKRKNILFLPTIGYDCY